MSTEGAVQVDQDEALVLDIALCAMSDTIENSNVVEKSISNGCLDRMPNSPNAQ